LRSCSEQEREIYRLYYLEGVSFIEICARLSREGAPLALEDLAESIRRMEGRIDHSRRRRLAYDLEARSIGATSGMLLEFLDEFKWRSRAQYEDQNPETALLRREAAAGLVRLRGLLDELPGLERDVLGLRFFAGYTAGQISQKLQVGNQRKVYSLIDRGLRRLRILFKDSGPTANVAGKSLEISKRPKPEPGRRQKSHEG
jgi:DNA-directed RNA polymerase specialized sigma24 family protein